MNNTSKKNPEGVRRGSSSRNKDPRPHSGVGQAFQEMTKTTLRVLAGKESSYWSSRRTGKMESLFLSLGAQGGASRLL